MEYSDFQSKLQYWLRRNFALGLFVQNSHLKVDIFWLCSVDMAWVMWYLCVTQKKIRHEKNTDIR